MCDEHTNFILSSFFYIHGQVHCNNVNHNKCVAYSDRNERHSIAKGNFEACTAEMRVRLCH